MSTAFNQAVAHANASKGGNKKLNNNQMLELYGLFKQASVGKNTTSKPGMFDLKGAAKWDAWNKVSALSKDQAMASYVAKVNQYLK